MSNRRPLRGFDLKPPSVRRKQASWLPPRTTTSRLHAALAAWTTETRPATKTTELMAYIGAVLAVAIAALLVGDGGDGGTDPFSAEQALRYITFLTIGYMIARGRQVRHPRKQQRPRRLTVPFAEHVIDGCGQLVSVMDRFA